jgi:hypothetical protein
MGFFDKLRDGWSLLTSSIVVLTKYPVFLVPIAMSWLVVAAIVLGTRYFVTFPDNLLLSLGLIFLFILIMTLSVCMANIMMLEFMQQIEKGKKISFSKALGEAVTLDMLKVIPIALIWAVIWFIILIIRALTSRENKSKSEPSARDAAMTLGGANSGPFSWLRLGLSMFEKLLRMYIFLTLPAIAWEDKGTFSAFKRSFEIIKTHPVQFLTAYSLTELTTLVMAIPLAIIYAMDQSGMVFSTTFWLLVIIYECVVWTFSFYLEQMSAAMLYLWHLKWVKKGSKGELSDVSMPSLLDDIYELQD